MYWRHHDAPYEKGNYPAGMSAALIVSASPLGLLAVSPFTTTIGANVGTEPGIHPAVSGLSTGQTVELELEIEIPTTVDTLRPGDITVTIVGSVY